MIAQIIKKLCLILVLAPITVLAGTAEQYGALPAVDDMEISPDGKTIALVQSSGGTSGVLFYDANDFSKQPVGIGLGEAKPRTIYWADNEHILLLVGIAETKRTSSKVTTIEFSRWMSISKSTGKAKSLFKNAAGYYQSEAGRLIATVPNQPGKAIFARSGLKLAQNRGPSRLNRGDEFTYNLYTADLVKGKNRLLERGNPDTVDWIVKPDGTPFARIDYDSSAELRKIYVKRDDKWALIASFSEERTSGSVASFYGLGASENIMLATTYGSRDKRSLAEFDTDTGTFTKTLFINDNYDIDGIYYNPAKATAEGIQYTDDLPRTFFLDPTLQKTQNALAKALPGATPAIASRTADNQRMIVKAIYTDHPDQYFLYDKVKKSLDMVGATYPTLDGHVEAVRTKFDYQTTDGFNITGYLTASKGADKSNMPLIVLPHGGPVVRDDQSFDWWAFYYASNGYLVYQPNFRGSGGFGYNFRTAGENEWGKKMQSDVTDGVKELINQGIADPNRICIAGASYGGYAALAGATFTPEMYKCVVSVAGVSNLQVLLAEAGDNSIWQRRIGNRFKDSKYIDSVSPSKHAGNVTAPILLIHGDDDIVVPIGQSRQMQRALKRAGKNVELVVLEGEDHWLSRQATRTEMLQKSLDFINTHIGQ